MKQVLLKTGKNTSVLTSYNPKKKKVVWIGGVQEIVSINYGK